MFTRAAYEFRQYCRQLVAFFARNLKEIRDPTSWKRKFRTVTRFYLPRFATSLVLFVPALLVGIAMRLLAPMIVVRISSINAARVGHLALDTEMLESEKQIGIGLPSRPVFDIYYPWTGPFPVSNNLLLAMWRRTVRVWPGWFWARVDSVSRLLPLGSTFMIPVRKGEPGLPNLVQGDAYGALASTKPRLVLSQDDISEAIRQLRLIGIDPEMPRVCLLVRDSAHYAMIGRDMGDHDYRNADIGSYVDAVAELAGRDRAVFRMGVSVAKPLEFEHPNFRDLALAHVRTELLDIFLSMSCSFFVSTGTGLDSLAAAARRPVLLTNYCQLGEFRLSMPTRVLPRRAVSIDDGRTLTISEQFERGLHLMTKGSEFEAAGVRFVPNSASEILDAVKEMDDRVSGNWKSPPDEEHLEGEFLSRVPEYLKCGGVRGGLVYSYLRDHPEWRS